MSSNAPIQRSGIGHKLATIWSDIAYAQLRMIELNRPTTHRRG
jgi:hypothetical protein